MHIRKISFIALLLVVSWVTVSAQTNSNAEVQKVVEKFWMSLGTLDPEAMRQTFDWPVTIVETSAKKTKNARVLTGYEDLEKDFRKGRPASGKSEFYGTKLGDFKFEMVNESLVVVTYVCTLPDVPLDADTKLFNAVTILRKNPSDSDAWKIMFITVPR